MAETPTRPPGAPLPAGAPQAPHPVAPTPHPVGQMTTAGTPLTDADTKTEPGEPEYPRRPLSPPYRAIRVLVKPALNEAEIAESDFDSRKHIPLAPPVGPTGPDDPNAPAHQPAQPGGEKAKAWHPRYDNAPKAERIRDEKPPAVGQALPLSADPPDVRRTDTVKVKDKKTGAESVIRAEDFNAEHHDKIEDKDKEPDRRAPAQRG